MLSQLASDFFARSPVLAWPIVALALFFALFLSLTARALLGRRDDMQRMAELPVSDAEVNRHE